MTFKDYPKTRLAIYGLSIAAAVAATFVAVESAEYGKAFDRAANILAAAAGATAISRLSPKQPSGDVPPAAEAGEEFPDLEVHDYPSETEWDPADFERPDEDVRDGSGDVDARTGPQNGDRAPSGRYGNHGP